MGGGGDGKGGGVGGEEYVVGELDSTLCSGACVSTYCVEN